MEYWSLASEMAADCMAVVRENSEDRLKNGTL